MGYMGFGLQKWIYTQKARRPFSKNRNKSINITDYHRDNDYVETSLSSKKTVHQITEEDRERAAKRLERKKRELKQFLIIKRILIVVLVSFGISLIILAYLDSKNPHDRNANMKIAMANSHCKIAQDYFDKGNFYAAHDNYMKALQYNPNSFEAYHGLVLVFGNLCGEKENHCINALNFIEKIEKKFPERDISDLKELQQLIKNKLEIN